MHHQYTGHKRDKINVLKSTVYWPSFFILTWLFANSIQLIAKFMCNTQTCSTLAAMLFVPLTGSAAFLDSEINKFSLTQKRCAKMNRPFRSVNRFLEDNKNELQIKTTWKTWIWATVFHCSQTNGKMFFMSINSLWKPFKVRTGHLDGSVS